MCAWSTASHKYASVYEGANAYTAASRQPPLAIDAHFAMHLELEERIKALRDLVRLINDASEVVIQEWRTQAKDPNPPADAPLLPSPALYDARRTLVGACGMASDLVAEPQQRLMEIACGYYSSRALHVAAEGRVADVLAETDKGEGVHVSAIASKTGVEHRKLGTARSKLHCVDAHN